jgi:hypothetical protein
MSRSRYATTPSAATIRKRPNNDASTIGAREGLDAGFGAAATTGAGRGAGSAGGIETEGIGGIAGAGTANAEP